VVPSRCVTRHAGCQLPPYDHHLSTRAAPARTLRRSRLPRLPNTAAALAHSDPHAHILAHPHPHTTFSCTSIPHRRYKYYIFLNSSIRGPFWPNYMPPRWQWTRAYTDLLRGDVKAVGSSLVCLPEVDAGEPLRQRRRAQMGGRKWGIKGDALGPAAAQPG
jgi:hypothetical protein